MLSAEVPVVREVLAERFEQRVHRVLHKVTGFDKKTGSGVEFCQAPTRLFGGVRFIV
jgi:hypothetical protein